MQPFGHNRNGPKIREGLCPLFGRGAGFPSSTMWPGPRPTSVLRAILIHRAVWPQRTWAENWGGGSAPYLGTGKLGPHLTRRPTSIPSGMLVHPAIGDNGYGPKIWGCAPLGKGELGPHLTQCVQGRGLPACQVSSGSVQPFGHSARTSQTGQDRQQTDSIGRTVLRTVAQKANTTLVN